MAAAAERIDNLIEDWKDSRKRKKTHLINIMTRVSFGAMPMQSRACQADMRSRGGSPPATAEVLLGYSQMAGDGGKRWATTGPWGGPHEEGGGDGKRSSSGGGERGWEAWAHHGASAYPVIYGTPQDEAEAGAGKSDEDKDGDEEKQESLSPSPRSYGGPVRRSHELEACACGGVGVGAGVEREPLRPIEGRAPRGAGVLGNDADPAECEEAEDANKSEGVPPARSARGAERRCRRGVWGCGVEGAHVCGVGEAEAEAESKGGAKNGNDAGVPGAETASLNGHAKCASMAEGAGEGETQLKSELDQSRRGGRAGHRWRGGCRGFSGSRSGRSGGESGGRGGRARGVGTQSRASSSPPPSLTSSLPIPSSSLYLDPSPPTTLPPQLHAAFARGVKRAHVNLERRAGAAGEEEGGDVRAARGVGAENFTGAGRGLWGAYRPPARIIRRTTQRRCRRPPAPPPPSPPPLFGQNAYPVNVFPCSSRAFLALSSPPAHTGQEGAPREARDGGERHMGGLLREGYGVGAEEDGGVERAGDVCRAVGGGGRSGVVVVEGGGRGGGSGGRRRALVGGGSKKDGVGVGRITCLRDRQFVNVNYKENKGNRPSAPVRREPRAALAVIDVRVSASSPVQMVFIVVRRHLLHEARTICICPSLISCASRSSPPKEEK
ncbi:hypothetical protein B0H11DRAFT_1942037 [Mycena galericulata]|nr:hypothetical protein B0H11DRAFT_1942037 [Mycena galericulata]